MPATWDRENVTAARHRRLIVALDAEADQLWFYARGPGERRLTIRGEEQSLVPLASHGEEGTDDHITVSTFQVPSTWAQGRSYPLIWGLYDGAEKLRTLFLRINKIGAATYAMSGRNVVLSSGALSELVDQRTVPRQKEEQPQQAEPSGAAGVAAPIPLGNVVGGVAAGDAGAGVASDATEEYINQAVAAARRFVRRKSVADPVRVVMRSRSLLAQPPSQMPLPISPRSGLKPPDLRDGWLVGDWLLGWAWDREDRERTLHVAVMCGGKPLIMVPAEAVDRSLNDVPGRGLHAFQIPVMLEYFEADRLHLEIVEGHVPVHQARLYVDRAGKPMLRRARPAPEPVQARDIRRGRKWRWWRR
ncbi:hypothetical protein [Nocardioides sp. KR10-350]|uniref:hypothetical protein n=1 Tax=Nocardioides cheoyonin TaxID=3156615 RepID=UPI0032B3EC3E